MTDKRELKPPPIAAVQPNAVEVLRMWAVRDGPQQLTLITHWDDPGAWGLLLVDIARHAAQAYAREKSVMQLGSACSSLRAHVGLIVEET